MFEENNTLDIARTRPRTRELPLTPLIDVVFILIVFFMLTTNFMKVESMELLLPGASGKSTPASRASQVYLTGNTGVTLGQRPIESTELEPTLRTLLLHNPDQRVIIYAAPDVTLQRLVEVMDTVYLTGGKSVYVKAWSPPPPPEAAP